MTLKDDLTDIHGIGDAKAEAILDVLAEHGGTGFYDRDVDDAIDQARRGNEDAVIAFLETLR